MKNMIDKELIKLLGDNKKYVFRAVLFMVTGLFASLGVTACICLAIQKLINKASLGEYIGLLICAVLCMAIRYAAGVITGNLKDLTGRNVKKDLRGRAYDKLVRLGVRSTDGMSMAGLTQVTMEGIEQLDLYYSSYLPQFFYAMLAP